MRPILVIDNSSDAALNQLLRDTPMPGVVELAYCRHPSVVESLALDGDRHDLFVYKDDKRIIGMGVRSIRSMYLDGIPREIAYLSGLRIRKEYRNGLLLARGYRFLRKLATDNPSSLHLTTIVEDNHHARGILTGGRAGMPTYNDLGRIVTSAIPLRKRSIFSPVSPVSVHRGRKDELLEYCRFLRTEGAKRQFFPCIDQSMFGTARLRGLSADDFVIARRDGYIMGLAAVWDQRSSKQHLITGYSPLLSGLRPILNIPASAAGFRPLPSPGNHLPTAHLAFCCVRDHSHRTLRRLISSACNLAFSKGCAFLVFSQHEKDPLLGMPRMVPKMNYYSRLYSVSWDSVPETTFNASRIPHIESSML